MINLDGYVAANCFLGVGKGLRKKEAFLRMDSVEQGVSCKFWDVKLLTNDSSQGPRPCGSLIGEQVGTGTVP